MRDVQSDMILENLGHQAVHPAANRRQQHQDVGALISFGDCPLHRADCPPSGFIRENSFCFSLEIPTVCLSFFCVAPHFS
jgi:hypothetical protein